MLPPLLPGSRAACVFWVFSEPWRVGKANQGGRHGSGSSADLSENVRVVVPVRGETPFPLRLQGCFSFCRVWGFQECTGALPRQAGPGLRAQPVRPNSWLRGFPCDLRESLKLLFLIFHEGDSTNLMELE